MENTRRACFPACLLHATKRLVTEGMMPGLINQSFITPVKLLLDVNFNNLHFWLGINIFTYFNILNVASILLML